jgi:Membrane proteins related to metalloendopeptidases
VIAEDDEPDHEARRSLFAGLPYLLTQRERARRGPRGIAGNHVVIAAGADGPFVLVAHLRRGSVRVTPGDAVRQGAPIGACGNSGNSTEPHVHLQATDSTDWATARGIPISFARTRVASVARGDGDWMPRNGEAFEAPPPEA